MKARTKSLFRWQMRTIHVRLDQDVTPNSAGFAAPFHDDNELLNDKKDKVLSVVMSTLGNPGGGKAMQSPEAALGSSSLPFMRFHNFSISFFSSGPRLSRELFRDMPSEGLPERRRQSDRESRVQKMLARFCPCSNVASTLVLKGLVRSLWLLSQALSLNIS